MTLDLQVPWKFVIHKKFLKEKNNKAKDEVDTGLQNSRQHRNKYNF